MGTTTLSTRQYKQMCGRAGRAGLDETGESFLMVSNENNRQEALDKLNAPLEPLCSQLGGKGFKRLLLEALTFANNVRMRQFCFSST